jgi:TatD DNase family protein
MTPTPVPDVHCHLDQLADPERAVDEALEAGVRPILAVGMEQASSERALELREKYPAALRVAVGLHPSEIASLEAEELRAELAFVEQTLRDADALGEVGLDYRDAVDEAQRQRQRDTLRQQLEWAERDRKPLSMHCRRAEHEIVDLATQFVQRTALGVNLHWFTHSEKLAHVCGEKGIYISPGPSIMSSEPQAGVARTIFPHYLLLETDSPVEFGGEPARPAWARQVAQTLADLRGESLESLAQRLQENVERYLRST